MEILILLFLLQCKHWYFDFGIQTYSQTIRKGIYKDPVGISHSLDHVVGTMIALSIFHLIHPLSITLILVIALLEGIAHYHIDFIKVKFGTKNMHSSAFWQQFGLDQFAHQITYILMIWYLVLR
jgi:hypothetical protein